MKDLLIGLALLSGPALVFALFGNSGLDAFDEGPGSGTQFAAAEAGRITYGESCAVCHGRLAQGTAVAPALVASGQGQGHLSDDEFRKTVVEGRRTAQGRGMPAFPALERADLDRIQTFLRSLERQDGIG